jgi:hypothetical protein
LALSDQGSATRFQDLSYNIYLPTNKLGTFTLFGFGGLSSDKFTAEKDSAKWEEKSDRYPSQFVSNTAMNGLTHTLLVGNKMNLKSSAGYSYTRNGYNEDYIGNDYNVSKNYKDNYVVKKWLFNSTMNYKFGNRLQLRGGDR